MVSHFLWLPVELQCEIIGRLLGSEDLKAVCLVSKHVAAIAAPFLYHDIVLDGNTAPIGRLTTIIKSLSESKNLGFARTLTIRNVVQDSVDAMDFLLPQLGEDCLKRFTARQELVGITHLTFKLLGLAGLFRAGDWIDLIDFPILAASDSHKRALYAGCRETEQAVARFSTFQQRQAQDSHTCPGWNPRPQIFGCVQFKSRREPGWTAKDVTVAIGGHSESITFLASDDCEFFRLTTNGDLEISS